MSLRGRLIMVCGIGLLPGSLLQPDARVFASGWMGSMLVSCSRTGVKWPLPSVSSHSRLTEQPPRSAVPSLHVDSPYASLRSIYDDAETEYEHTGAEDELLLKFCQRRDHRRLLVASKGILSHDSSSGKIGTDGTEARPRDAVSGAQRSMPFVPTNVKDNLSLPSHLGGPSSSHSSCGLS